MQTQTAEIITPSCSYPESHIPFPHSIFNHVPNSFTREQHSILNRGPLKPNQMGNNGPYFKLILWITFRRDERTAREKNACSKFWFTLVFQDSNQTTRWFCTGCSGGSCSTLLQTGLMLCCYSDSLSSQNWFKKKNKRKDCWEWQVSQDARELIRLLSN